MSFKGENVYMQRRKLINDGYYTDQIHPRLQTVGYYQGGHFTINLTIYKDNTIFHISLLHTAYLTENKTTLNKKPQLISIPAEICSQSILKNLISIYELSSWYSIMKINPN